MNYFRDHSDDKKIDRITKGFAEIVLISGGILLIFIYIIPVLRISALLAPIELVPPLLVYLLYICFSALGIKNIKSLFGILCTFLPGYFLWQIVNETLVRNEPWMVVPIIGIVGWIFIISTSLFGLYLAVLLLYRLFSLLIHAIGKRIDNKNQTQNGKNKILNEIRTQKSILATSMISLIVFTSLAVAIDRSNLSLGYMTIQPLDYNARFAFWASHYNDTYTPAQRDALNRHKAILALYTNGPLDNIGAQNAFIESMNWWKVNYPDVQFLPTVPGIPGGFVWDGSTEGSIEAAKRIVQICKANNLTNVIGLNFDWEHPVEETLPEGTSILPNKTRNDNAIQKWNEFFDWIEGYAPEYFLSCVNYYQLAQDAIDDDFDLHIREKYITFSVPRWDEYAPMIYRCGYKGTKPFGDVPRWNPKHSVDTSYDFYRYMKAHADGVKMVEGNLDKLGVYLGITNCTCYGRDVEIYEYGEFQGNGFDMLVRDALIAKSFGPKIITIFILNTVIESGYSMGGVFESYGDDFLDRFNASVNGPDSRKAFQIPIGFAKTNDIYLPEVYAFAYLDLVYNLNNFFIVFLLVASIIAGNFIYFKKLKKINRIQAENEE